MNLTDHFLSSGVYGLNKRSVAGNKLIVDEEVSVNYLRPENKVRYYLFAKPKGSCNTKALPSRA
jgi:hypothetical protein